MSIDNRLHDDFMILINNTRTFNDTYMDFAFKAIKKAKGNFEDAASLLADVLKNRFEWMVDDINLRQTRKFPRYPDQVKGREDDPAEERKVMIQALVMHSFSQVNWLKFAKDLLNQMKETNRWKQENEQD